MNFEGKTVVVCGGLGDIAYEINLMFLQLNLKVSYNY